MRTLIALLAGGYSMTIMPLMAVAQTACGPSMPASARSACMQQYYADVDMLLAAAYKSAMASTETSGLGRNLVMDWRRALQDAQRKWLSYREADCGPPMAYETARTASDRDRMQLACRIAHTEARLAALSTRYPK